MSFIEFKPSIPRGLNGIDLFVIENGFLLSVLAIPLNYISLFLLT